MPSTLKDESLKKKVIIKWRAYVKMLKHVLRFGSMAKPKSQYKEVMGMLIGHLADQPGLIKDVIIEDAVPISHGGHIEVAFKPEDYGSFSIIDSQFADRGWFTVGWYHSHPGLSCFFSAVDIRNQMGWQGPNNSAIGIVWDHTRLENIEGDMGFEIYRLDDPQNPMTDYHKINWVVEPPDDLKFYFEGIIDLINNIKREEPPILELNEVPDVFGDFEVPGQSELMSKEPELEFKEISESLKGGIEKISESFIKPLVNYINEWARSITQGITSKNVIMLQNLKNLRENLSKSMGDLQSWFKFALNDNLRNVWVEIDDKFEAETEKRKLLSKKMEELSNNLNKIISNAFDKAILDATAEILKKTSSSIVSLTDTEKNIGDLTNTIISQKGRIEGSINTFKEKGGEIKKNCLTLPKETSNLFKKSLNPAFEKLEKVQKKLSEIRTSLKALEGMIK